MKKYLAIFLTIVSLLAFAVPYVSKFGQPVPPDGVVYGMQLGSTAYGITRALSDKPDTFIMIKEGTRNVLFGWQIENAAAFTCMGAGGANCAKDMYEMIKSGGNVVNFRDMLALRQFLAENGWKVIPAAELPIEIRAMLTGATVLVNLARSMPTILILPVGVFDYQPYVNWKG